MGAYALAIDLGASSGRHILGRIENGHIVLQEIDRFPNEIVKRGKHCCWEIDMLYQRIVDSLRKCATMGMHPATLGIDTWGVDYALISADGSRLGDTITYRDPRTEGFPDVLDQILSPALMYATTGIARQSYNTIYQLMAELAEHRERSEQNIQLLFTPCYLGYRLTGIARNEYTIASTSGLLNARTRQWDTNVLRSAGIPASWFRSAPAMPGEPLGALLPALSEELGFHCKVVLPATHDTGSAYLAVPSVGGNTAILSSGTWSLLGMELDAPVLTAAAHAAGFTNEGGYGGKIAFVRNIMGLWILQCIRREWKHRMTYAQLAECALSGATYAATFDAADERFLSPDNMIEEIYATLRDAGEQLPMDDSELLYCVHHSLALCYHNAVQDLAKLTRRAITSIHVVGGGCQNRTLNQLTADTTGLTVFAGPSEATAMGNLIAQWIASGEIAGIEEAHIIVKRSMTQEVFQPR